MGTENIQIRPATLSDLDGVAAIYSALWCNWLRSRGDEDDALLVSRFNIAMQFRRSPIALVAEHEGTVIAACLVGIFDGGTPRGNAAWESCYSELLVAATARAAEKDELEGALFGDSRENATADRFAATGNEYAKGQVNLIVILPEWQGRGLGRRLMEAARDALASEGCDAFFLMTDNHSDYAFYDHLGMVRVAEDHSQDTGDGFIVYIYGDKIGAASA